MAERGPEHKPLLKRRSSSNDGDDNVYDSRSLENTTYTYGRPLPADIVDAEQGDLKTVTTRAAWKTTGALMFLGIFMVLVFLFDKGLQFRKSVSDPPLGLPEKVQRRWGQYSPYFPAGKYKDPPKLCRITQVNILHRHGARYPNAEDDYDKAVTRLASAHKYKDGKLKFLHDYEYTLPEESLLPFGAEQSFQSGKEVFSRYAPLITADTLPYVRTTSKARVVESAGNWTEGFAAASRHTYNPYIAQILSESVNNTLNDDCPAAHTGTKEKNTWLSIFAPPIVKRLTKAAPGSNLTNEDVHRLLALCPFETMANQRPSPFCDLFTAEEFEYFEYFGDVEKYYKDGPGNNLGPVRGVGYVNELLARLTGRPVQDKTTHNASFPFPLDRTLYADFTHENVMLPVFVALGMFNVTGKDAPDPREMKRHRKWNAREMVPFSARMVVERLVCDGERDVGVHGVGRREGEKEYVRVFVNDALQPLGFCGADVHGMCTVDEFVESQGYARRNGDGDFERCYH